MPTDIDVLAQTVPCINARINSHAYTGFFDTRLDVRVGASALYLHNYILYTRESRGLSKKRPHRQLPQYTYIRVISSVLNTRASREQMESRVYTCIVETA